MASLEENPSDTNCTEPSHVAHEQEQGEEPEIATDTALVPAKQAVLSDTDDDTEDEPEDEHKDDANDEKKFEKSSVLLPRRSRAPRAVTVDPLDMIGRQVEQTFPKFGSSVWRGTVRAFSVACVRVCLYCAPSFVPLSLCLCVCRIDYVLSVYLCLDLLLCV